MDTRSLVRDAVRGDTDPDRLSGLDDIVDRVMVALELSDDPRKLGGSIAGPGGPYAAGEFVIDTRNAVILDAVEVAVVGGVRQGVLDPKPITALVLRGRVNKTDDRAQVLFLLNEDGAAGIVTELVGVASRAGWATEFLARVRDRLKDMPTAPPSAHRTDG